jgi:copper chaperone CopZ
MTTSPGGIAMSRNGNEYTVKAMHCSHCSISVTEKVSQIDGVDAVEVDVPTGSLTFTSHTPIDPNAVRAAVEGAGYELESA